MLKLAKILFILAAIIIGVIIARAAEPVSSDVVFVTQYSDGTTNTWTQADLVAALGLLNRKYHRDCKNAQGRKAWHGKLKREIVNTNELTKTEIYEDGTSFTYKHRINTPAQAVANRNKRIMLTTNGVPARIAAARAKRMREIETTNTVNQVLKAGE
jgi:adenosyl cobinamide kinase/adenosyl cobinamide phosphate guanylyltransferase